MRGKGWRGTRGEDNQTTPNLPLPLKLTSASELASLQSPTTQKVGNRPEAIHLQTPQDFPNPRLRIVQLSPKANPKREQRRDTRCVPKLTVPEPKFSMLRRYVSVSFSTLTRSKLPRRRILGAGLVCGVIMHQLLAHLGLMR